MSWPEFPSLGVLLLYYSLLSRREPVICLLQSYLQGLSIGDPAPGRAANQPRLFQDTGAICRGRMPTRQRLEFNDTRPGFDGPSTICTNAAPCIDGCQQPLTGTFFPKTFLSGFG